MATPITVSFKGISSSAYALSTISVVRPIFPDVTRFTKSIPLYAGTYDYDMDTYGEKTITVVFRYNYSRDFANLQVQAEQISGWLYNDSNYYKLIFSDAPNRVLTAKVVSAVDMQTDYASGIISVSFLCNPPFPCDLNNNPVTPADIAARLLWDTALLDDDGITYIQEFSSNGTMQFTNKGTLAVNPVIKLIGSFLSGVMLTYGTLKFQLDIAVNFDTVIIDCHAMTVTLLSSSISLFSSIDITNNSFFTIQPGQNTISVSGVAGAFPNNLSVAITFTPMYS